MTDTIQHFQNLMAWRINDFSLLVNLSVTEAVLCFEYSILMQMQSSSYTTTSQT